MYPRQGPLASKDCYTCNRRRIHCDRTLPTCIKCNTKGVDCPGYGNRIRWKFVAPGGDTTAASGRGESTPKATEQHPSDEPVESTNISPQGDTVQLVGSPRNLSTPASRGLLDFYSANIAPMMVWLHSVQDEYQRLVVPLAEREEVLRLAIMAIVAARAPGNFNVDADFSRRSYEGALTLIAERARLMSYLESHNEHMNADTTASSNEATLAAAIILANHSLIGAEIIQAQIHRQAVRILIKAIALANTSDKELFIFLQNQAAIHDVLVCTMSFDPETIQKATLPISKPGEVMFGRFLRYLHHITTLSMADEERLSVDDMEDAFELASSSTIAAAASLCARDGTILPDDFTRLVRIYHHAAVLYACQRLRMSNVALVEQYHMSSLFRLFKQFENLDMSLYNLAWPILVSGICGRLDLERTHLVRNLTKAMLAKTEFWYYSRISAFHEELWESPHDDWLSLASAWEQRGQPIIAV